MTDKTDPDWGPIMKMAAAIVTNRGGRTCHAAIVGRELGLPAVVGTERGTDVLHEGDPVTVRAPRGTRGWFTRGSSLETSSGSTRGAVASADQSDDEPWQSGRSVRPGSIPNDGVCLARMEFVISDYIKIHPLALIEYERLDDRWCGPRSTVSRPATTKATVLRRHAGFGRGMIAAPFYPKDVIVRMSDFKSNEYANLIGGAKYEPHEENPMIGFRGARATPSGLRGGSRWNAGR